ncbi:MAG: purine-binding chemotaxis protein CheW [Caulobacterales bacterium]|jgi:purine-binding chemotaxis protein CheW|nr:purine-binding chemotaxis protein CheW [Caulobacterales bacterium]
MLREESHAGAAEKLELMLFRVSGQEYCIDIQDVREIRGWAAATPLPQAPQYVRGVINLRGAVLPIVDLAERLGFGRTEASARNAILVVRMGDGLVGLLVDEVSEILTAEPNALQPTPQVCENGRSFVKGILVEGDRLISWIVLEEVLPRELDIAA